MPLLEFEVFFKQEYEPMVRALTLALGDRSSAEESAQEGFAKAFGRWKRVGSMERPAAWVYVVAMRHQRGHPRREPVASTVAVVENPDNVDDRLTVSALLGHLTPRQRQAIVLRYHADLSLAEVAAVLGCRVGTAKATLHQALGRLRISSTVEVQRDGHH